MLKQLFGSAAAMVLILITITRKENSRKKVHTILTLVSRSFSNFNIKCYWYALLLNKVMQIVEALFLSNVSTLKVPLADRTQVMGAIISHDLFSGGSDKIYSVSGSHLDQEGIVGRLNLDF
jgi:hypothetical protein